MVAGSGECAWCREGVGLGLMMGLGEGEGGKVWNGGLRVHLFSDDVWLSVVRSIWPK